MEAILRKKIRLGVNVDHVATLRNARGSEYPDPMNAALMAQEAGADGITAHLREDRRHILEKDLENIMSNVSLPLNLEMAATSEMKNIALKYRPNAICLVPENRLELTTEGGLDVKNNSNFLRDFVKPLRDVGSKVSIFLAADQEQIDAAIMVGATTVELHTGKYCDFHSDQNFAEKKTEFNKIRKMAEYASSHGMEVHAGHGLTLETVTEISSVPQIEELNIGHSLISDAIFSGLYRAIENMRLKMDEGRTRNIEGFD